MVSCTQLTLQVLSFFFKYVAPEYHTACYNKLQISQVWVLTPG